MEKLGSAYASFTSSGKSDNFHLVFIALLVQSGSSPSVIDSVFYSVKFVHQLISQEDPTLFSLHHKSLTTVKNLNSKTLKYIKKFHFPHLDLPQKIYSYK